MTEALFYSKHQDNRIICRLCPHECSIANGKHGICRVRKNIDGVLISENFGKLSAIHLDPIEKKPLYHYYPGSHILSVGSVGCNMQCQFCQNCEISQSGVAGFPALKSYLPRDIVELAARTHNNLGIAYTYNEPTVFYEFMLEISALVSANNLRNVVVTNGFIAEEPFQKLLEYADAFNIDLKSFEDDFYRKYTHSALEPVKKSLVRVRKSGRHLEITNLIIPGLNDDEAIFREMVKWIAGELGPATVLHLSRYFPRHRMTIESTPLKLLEKNYFIAREFLTYVYMGNVAGGEGQDTYCAGCKSLAIERRGYQIVLRGVAANGSCIHCGQHIVIRNK